MAVDTLVDKKRDYYQTQLGYSDLIMSRKSLADLEREFFENPPAGGGGGGGPHAVSHLTTDELDWNALAPTVIADPAWEANDAGRFFYRSDLQQLFKWNGVAPVPQARAFNDFLGPRIIGPSYDEYEAVVAPVNPAAGKRRIFLDSVTGKLSVRTSTGATVSLEEQGGGGTVIRKRKAADQSSLTNVNFTNDDTLFFAIGIGETYEFTIEVFYDASTTGDILVGIDGPAGATGKWHGIGLQTSATGITDTQRFAAQTIGTTRAFGGVAVGTLQYLVIKGIIVNPTNAGNCQMKFSQNALDATNATRVQLDSYLEAAKF